MKADHSLNVKMISIWVIVTAKQNGFVCDTKYHRKFISYSMLLNRGNLNRYWKELSQKDTAPRKMTKTCEMHGCNV